MKYTYTLFGKWLLLPALLAFYCIGCKNTDQPEKLVVAEAHRPLIHFTPAEKWMNDPNGMVYHKGIYHLFYQYYPDSTIWGPMHWGHAISTDMIHWQHKPIALYPDSLGWIFSGSAVVDVNNTAGFAQAGDTALVAIFTSHGHDSSTNKMEVQSLAYSLDNGETWVKYNGNPVLNNQGEKDFRDPKVFWHEAEKKWVMTLAVKDKVEFYTSPNLKNWTKTGSFGTQNGAHGGVWECPDLLQMQYKGQKVWVLLVNINPGGPNGGSATQYFIGNFDGKNFTANHTDTRWLDYGTDEYAGVTFSNTPNRTILIGWMSNWLYADKVPTKKWRSAMTLPRELTLQEVNGQLYVASMPVKEAETLFDIKNNRQEGEMVADSGQQNIVLPITIDLQGIANEDLEITFSNEAGEKLVIGYRAAEKLYFIDRRLAGDSSFSKGFAIIQTAPRIILLPTIDLKLIMDVSSVELFADGGLTTMTSIFFPSKVYNMVTIKGKNTSQRITKMKGAW